MQATLDFSNRAPIAAKADPSTSHAAGREYTNSGKRSSDKKKLLDWMKANRRWMTSMEISTDSGLERYMVARRLPDLLADGFVERGPAMDCMVSRKKAVTWKAKLEASK